MKTTIKRLIEWLEDSPDCLERQEIIGEPLKNQPLDGPAYDVFQGWLDGGMK